LKYQHTALTGIHRSCWWMMGNIRTFEENKLKDHNNVTNLIHFHFHKHFIVS
jgi:hypothetical protein